MYVLVKRNSGEPRTQAYYADTVREARKLKRELERGGRFEYRVFAPVDISEAKRK